MREQDGRDNRLRKLMVAAQAGDRSAYSALLNEAASLLRALVRRRYGYLGREDVEDVVQEILLSVHSVRSTYDAARPFLPWLMAIAHNRSVDAIRRLSRRSTRETTVAEYPETSDPVETNLAGGGYGDPEVLRLAVAALPESQRKAIELVKLREMSLKEAASESGMSVGAIKIAVHRATRSLRLTLGGRNVRED
jgi:RNA polymerase sigma factor (sigma-70 family)